MLSTKSVTPLMALIIVVPFAAALPPGRDPTFNSTTTVVLPAPDKPSEVGWQSIFWGLFALALNAMTQSSFVDAEVFDKPNLLFPARSSPIVCAYDALDILVRLVKLVFVKGKTLSDAAASIQAQRSPNQGNVEESLWRKYPWPSLIFFVGIATQAVKIFAFHGPGIAWAQAAAAMYFGSYIVLAAVSYFAAAAEIRTQHYDEHDEDDEENEHDEQYKKNQLSLANSVLVIHGLCACCVMYKVFNFKDDLEKCRDANFFTWFFCAYGYGINFVVKSVVEVAAGAATLFGIFFLLFAIGGGLPPFFGNRVYNALLVVALVIVPWICYPYWSHLVLPAFIFVDDQIIGRMVQGGGYLLVGYWIFSRLNRFKNWVCTKVPFLQHKQPLSSSQFDLIAFAVLNLVAASLYYSFGYKSQGTIKPAWTEKLG